MGKLRKLFPLSFKHCKNVKSLILCALLYLLIEVAAGIVGGLVVQPIISAVVGMLLLPITIMGLLMYVGGILICCTDIGAIIGVPMILLGFPLLMIPETITSLIMAVVCGFATVYTMVGCTVAVLAYAGVFGEITFPAKEKKNKKAKESTPAIEE